MPSVPSPPRPPFRRIAVVLPGGGAFGAYEAGVLRALERAAVRPAILAGTSAGAINAAVWLANDFRSAVPERAWRSVRPATIGIRWTTLALRAAGGLLFALGLLQAALTVLGSSNLALARRLWGAAAARYQVDSEVLDAVAWAAIAGLGALVATMSRPAEEWLASWEGLRHPAGLSRWLGRVLLVGVALHVLTWGLGLPWPRGFSATLLVAGGLVYVAVLPGPAAERARAMVFRLIPETRGSGLWRGGARRRLLARLVGKGDAARLTGSDTLLVITALALDNGRIVHFVSGPDPGPRFRERVERGLGEVIELDQPAEVLEAVVASSAIPLLFEPVRIRGRDYVDAGQFSNQPLAAVLAAHADAVVVVLLVPPSEPRATGRGNDLVSLGARLIQIANWRSLQLEMAGLPGEWSEGGPGAPRRAVLVAPEATLPGGLLAFDRDLSEELIQRGEADAWRALREAGWVDAGESAGS